MGEIDFDDDHPRSDQPDDKFYFVDEERLKERLAGDAPSFSVASLFSSSAPSTEPPPQRAVTSAPAPVFAKQSLFMLDPTDSRIADVGKFFTDVPSLSDPEMTARRREIQSMVYRKSKRSERNEAKYSKSGSKNYSRNKHYGRRIQETRQRFKKQKT